MKMSHGRSGSVIQGCFPRGVAPRVVQQRSQPSPTGMALQIRDTAAPRGHNGKPLPAPVLQKMERIFGTQFANVRVHVTHEVQAMGATALTRGNDIYVAPGQYDPATPAGQRLLAHELTHVVQQRANRVRNPFTTGVAVVQDSQLEAEAERMAMRASMPEPPRRAQAVQPKIRIKNGEMKGYYESKNVTELLNGIAVVINRGGLKVSRGPLEMLHSDDQHSIDNVGDLVRFMTDRDYDLDFDEKAGRLLALTVEYGAEHGDYHFTGHVTAQKAQWTLSKLTALGLMEAEIQKHKTTLLTQSARRGWTTWYIIADHSSNVGDTVGGSVRRFTMQVQVSIEHNTISYHGYPDQRATKTGIGRSKSSVQ
jgi:hypothetical protein